jgi:zinc protease
VKNWIKAAAVLFSLPGLPAVGAEKQGLPKDLPPYGPMRPVNAPSVKELKLENGLAVWLVPRPGFPKVALSVILRGGYTADPKDRPGMADLIAATVTQGTSNRSAKALAEEIAAAGGDLNADSNADWISIETSVLSSGTNAALDILADVMQHAAFAESETEIAKKNLISSLEASEADPSFLGRRALYHAMYGDHPYGTVSPTKDSISKTTAEELRRQYSRRFRPERALLVASGDFTEATITPVIRLAFGGWTASAEAATIDESKPKQSVTHTIIYVPRENSVQTAFYIGAYGPTRSDPDYAAARVATAIYGGMFGSRLISNIREDKGYTYSPGVRLAPRRQSGLMMTSASVRNPVTGASFNEIEYELNRMATTAPEPTEVESAKRFVLGSTAISLQSRQSQAETLARLWIDSLTPEEINKQARQVEGIKPEDVQIVGHKYFPAWRAMVIAVGEEKVIKDELAPFGMEFQKAP